MGISFEWVKLFQGLEGWGMFSAYKMGFKTMEVSADWTGFHA